jgi:hypothetical protein
MIVFSVQRSCTENTIINQSILFRKGIAMTQALEAYLDDARRARFAGLDSPTAIQAFLDETPYSTADFNRCPLRVLQDGAANCMDGALLAAAALRRMGQPPLIVDMLPEPGSDDDHVLAIYKRNGCFGSIAKSNFSCLRSREPVYRSLRELIMSYFDVFYNLKGQKTLRGYSRPVRLSAFDRLNWEVSDAGVDAIERHLYTLRPVPVLTPEMAAGLSPMDPLSYQSGLLGSNPEGLFKGG